MTYTCSKCGKEHEARPSIAFDSPFHYDALSEADKKSFATLSNDFCVIHHPEQTDRFIRGVLHQKINDDCETLDYGVWVSLSEKSYNDYRSNYDNELHEATYFGFLCNNLSGYEITLSIKCDVVLRGKIRPEVIPHENQTDNAFVRDYFAGIDSKAVECKLKDVIGV